MEKGWVGRGDKHTFLIHSVTKTFHQVLVLGVRRTARCERTLEPRDVVCARLRERAECRHGLVAWFGQEEPEAHEALAARDD
jgi:hypothetical protein